MDGFINLAKQGLSAYQESQNQSNPDVAKTGGQEYNSPNNSAQQQGGQRPNFNHDEVVNAANRHGSGDSSLFANALNFVNGNPNDHHGPIDERQAQDAHDQAYNQGGAGNLGASGMGTAAAMQVFKSFTSGGSSGGSQSQLMSMAMAEASKLFDQSGGAASGSKQDVVNGAAMTVMKLLVQSKFSNMMGGGNSGGLSGLMGLASKFA